MGTICAPLRDDLCLCAYVLCQIAKSKQGNLAKKFDLSKQFSFKHIIDHLAFKIPSNLFTRLSEKSMKKAHISHF